MSKKIEFKEHGGPEVLKYIDYELSSDKPSFNEIRIEHLSIGVNFIDIYHRVGLYPVSPPAIPGLEAVGRITSVGKNVNDFKVGDRVGYSSPPPWCIL